MGSMYILPFENLDVHYVIISLKFARVHLAEHWHELEAKHNQQHKRKYSFKKGCSYVHIYLQTIWVMLISLASLWEEPGITLSFIIR